MQEGHTKEIELKEDDPKLVNRMLRWCYAHCYDPTPATDDENEYVVNVKMYALADKYGVEDLKRYSITMFRKNMSDIVMSNATTSQIMLDAIQVLYTTTPDSNRGLRDELTRYLRQNMPHLKSNKAFIKLFKSGLADGDFAYDVLQAWMAESEKSMSCCFCIRERANSSGDLFVCDTCGSDCVEGY